MKRNNRFVIIVLLILATSMFHPPVAHAATITVQSAADDGTAIPANCPGLNCRLRDAISKAESGDTITFAGDYTINLTTSELNIFKNLTIDGAGRTVVINGPGASCTTCFRVFYVSGPYTFNLSNLTVANGNDTSGAGGGAIYSDVPGSTLTITNVTFSGNSSTQGGGAISFIATSGSSTLAITNVTFSGNSSIAGGAIYLDEGTTTTVMNSAFLNNSSTSSGGGILSYETLTVINSTFSGNTASTYGGGLAPNDGAATIINSTFSGNSAGTSGSGVRNSGGTLTLRNTIVANNTGSANCNGTITNGGNNIDDGTSCGFGSSNGSQSSTNPQLGALTNGVFPLNYNSPAIDGVTYNAPNSCPSTDQRGQVRDDLACDIGAYEMQMSDSNSTTLNPGTTMRTFGPPRAGIQYTGTDPGSTTVTKVTNWTNGKPENALGAWWEITPMTGTGLNLTLKLCYSDAELGGLTESSLRFWRYNGSMWSQFGDAPTLSGTSPNRCAEISGVSTLSRWTLATSQPTAITLSSFRARASSFNLWQWLTKLLGR